MPIDIGPTLNARREVLTDTTLGSLALASDRNAILISEDMLLRGFVLALPAVGYQSFKSATADPFHALRHE